MKRIIIYIKTIIHKVISLFCKKEIKYKPTMYLYYDKELLEESQKVEIEKFLPSGFDIKWINTNNEGSKA